MLSVLTLILTAWEFKKPIVLVSLYTVPKGMNSFLVVQEMLKLYSFNRFWGATLCCVHFCNKLVTCTKICMV
jgi:hypothetical protein